MTSIRSFGKMKRKGENESEWKWKKKYFFKIRSGGFLINGKLRFGAYTYYVIIKVEEGGEIGSFGRKTKKLKFLVWFGWLPKNKNPKIRSGGLLKNKNPKIPSSGSGGLLTFRKRETKIRLECRRCLSKNGKNQRFVIEQKFTFAKLKLLNPLERMRTHKAISRILKFPKSTITDTIVQYKNFNTGLMAKRRCILLKSSLESPCSGLYRRKKSSPIEPLDPEIFKFKVEALWKAFDLLRYKFLTYIYFV
ncbi:hypothetical protein GLOIN_2v1766788 [Rhizophagus irregularis DAOM 181602=DAOM 197198]|nr:hypothetical protein GLOIN_2v1766788 [Rhizophagus irregularis DAOM 181602=DAOM 197198]